MMVAARPRITLKLATSLDGRIAMASGESRWITGEAARETVHAMRASHDCVMVGIGTALADDPELTVRGAKATDGQQPTRVVIDSRCRLPCQSKLAQTAKAHPVFVYTGSVGVDGANAAALSALGVVVRSLSGAAAAGQVDLSSAFADLHQNGVASVLVEGGGRLAASLLNERLVDRLEWMRAPIILGDTGVPAIGALQFSRLADSPRFRRVGLQVLGDDVWESFEI